MSDKSLKEKIIEEINKSGFPLELEIVEKLLSNNCLTFPNISFQDDKGFIHEIDLLSIISTDPGRQKNGVYGVQLLAECKKTEKYSWVFFSEGYHPFSSDLTHKIDYSSDSEEHAKKLNSIYKDFSYNFLTHHYNNRLPKARTHFEAFKKPTEQTTIYKAINNIFFARKFLKDWFTATINNEAPPRSFLNHFTIIIDGNLFLATKIKEDFEVSEVNHILLLAFDTQENHHSGLLDNEIVIDVIKKEYFEEYLKLLKNDARLVYRHLESGT